jgi:L-seryl-tRNA(Ser) seleniumtransferase
MVHPSNFRLEGFTSSVDVAELAGLGVPVVADIGSGLLAPHPLLPDEPDAETSLRAGAAVVTASGDKLLGGPQAGLLLGRADVVEQLRRHPLARALRVDKLTLAALEATLRGPRTPTWQSLSADADVLRRRCERLAELVGGHVVASDGAVGGGGAPGQVLPGWAVALPASYAAALRAGDPCVVGRLERDRCLLDLRAVPEEDDLRLAAAVRACTS